MSGLPVPRRSVRPPARVAGPGWLGYGPAFRQGVPDSSMAREIRGAPHPGGETVMEFAEGLLRTIGVASCSRMSPSPPPRPSA